MAQGNQVTGYIPTSLVGVNSPSPTLASELYTSLPIATGAFPGNCFFLTEAQANQASLLTVNQAQQITCHEGWYAIVQVSAAAVAANIKAGAIGAPIIIPTTSAQSNANTPVASIVTDGATAFTAGLLGLNPVVFLNPVTPGNYTIVQVDGDANVLFAANQTTIAAGSLVAAGSPGTVTANTTFNALTMGIVEIPITTPAGALTLSAVAAASSGQTVYTGTITGGGTNNYAGQLVTITGFTGAALPDNGTYTVVANTTTTLTLANPNGVAATAAGTATLLNLGRVSFQPPFGQV